MGPLRRPVVNRWQRCGFTALAAVAGRAAVVGDAGDGEGPVWQQTRGVVHARALGAAVERLNPPAPAAPLDPLADRAHALDLKTEDEKSGITLDCKQ